MSPMPRAVFILAPLLIVLSLGACASASPTATNDRVHVVASTNVYGDIASAIGADRVDVTSIIADPSQDPHAFQADARVQLALSRADIVIENGGGYDAWIDPLLSGSGNTDTTVVTVATLSGYDLNSPSGEFNVHLWYDFPTMRKLVNSLVADFSRADPKSTSTFQSNAQTFESSLANLQQEEGVIKSAQTGTGVAITEPVPLYMLNACGLHNLTPEQFSRSIQDETDVAPLVLRDTLELFSHHQVKALVYNEQTTGPETQKVLDAATSAGIAIVPVTETLPPGKTYLTWMASNLQLIASALK
jgi:zinc/manganese transport system substrate-binding protein